MKRLLVACILCCCLVCLNAQPISIQLDRMNEFYIGIDNPITITASNVNYKNIVVKAENGIISGGPIKFTYSASKVGVDILTVYKIANGKLKKLGSVPYRIIRISPPVFKIGTYGRYQKVKKSVIINQEFVRAEFENSFFDSKARVDSFTLVVTKIDSCKSIIVKNRTNKIGDELHNIFENLQSGDIILFKDIFVSYPGFESEEIEPLTLTVE